MSRGLGQPARGYRMDRRAELVDETRQRIVQATVGLHGSVGPARTTIVAIAEAAGVTRATVYRHFPDEDVLFEACSAHWLSRQSPPDLASWSRVADPVDRMRVALTDLYRFYRAGESMLTRIYRDKASLPSGLQRSLDAREAGIVARLREGLEPRRARRQVAAALGHAVSFWTWRSLCVDHGLSNRDAVEFMVGMVVASSGPLVRVPRATQTRSGVGT